MDRQPELQVELDDLIKSVLGDNTPSQAYFQPPEGINMVFPCIRYERSRSTTLFADNQPYLLGQGYQLIVIDRNPNSELREAVRRRPMTIHERWYAVDGLNHDVFNTYF